MIANEGLAVLSKEKKKGLLHIAYAIPVGKRVAVRDFVTDGGIATTEEACSSDMAAFPDQ
ncbi:hypothetical protein KDAU_54990 [Dictyobacter aurantiacus]|uniref:Uncharacterized protein n=1 Tax=Dictyobacter aurantiacus TaxID=1936993 RepID=A0A401ZMY6_9CHLR|nr:hypothetical protein KDAU_54990 [Dictyobacter aurantiacus]